MENPEKNPIDLLTANPARNKSTLKTKGTNILTTEEPQCDKKPFSFKSEPLSHLDQGTRCKACEFVPVTPVTASSTDPVFQLEPERPTEVTVQTRPRTLEICAGSGGLSLALWKKGFNATGVD